MKRHWRNIALAACAAAILFGCQAAEALELVRDGKPLATIVSQPGRAASRPSELLQEWVKMMTGAELPIAEQAPVSGPAVYIGQKAVEAGLKLDDIESASDEGLRIKCDGRNVYIAGQNDESTLRATGRFMEAAWGCRYLLDHPLGMVYPKTKTLAVEPMELSEAPKCRYRNIWGAEGAFRNPIWKIWNGHGGISYPMSHAWGEIRSFDFDEHPDWFRMDENGKRVKGPWPNLGNEQLRKAFKQAVIDRYKAAKSRRNISMSPPDDHRFDYSPEAKKYDEPVEIDPTSGRPSMTNRFMGLVNEIAQELYKIDPKGVVSFYAYSDYTLPPTSPALAKLSPNVCAWIAPIRYSRFHQIGSPNSESRQLLKKIIDGWAEHASMLGYRTYNYNLAESMTPYSKISIWSHDMPYLYRKGCIGFNLESFSTWDIAGPHLYLSIRLAYDPTQDPAAIMDDYFEKLYGPAAQHLKAYWMEIDKAWTGLKTEAGSIHSLHHVWTPQRLAELDGLLKKAEAAAKGDETLAKRVAMNRIGWEHARDWRKVFDLMNEGKVAEATAVYDTWYARTKRSIQAGTGHVYNDMYQRRFIGGLIDPKRNKKVGEFLPPNRVVQVLPDEMKFCYQSDLEKGLVTPDHSKVGREAKATVKAAAGNCWGPSYDDSSWPTVKTRSETLNAQGYPDYFGVMWYRTSFQAPQTAKKLSVIFVKNDRWTQLYVNGKPATPINAGRPQETELGPGYNAWNVLEFDVTGLVRPGKNQLTVMVERIPLPELYLGGIVRPVYLVEKAQ